MKSSIITTSRFRLSSAPGRAFPVRMRTNATRASSNSTPTKEKLASTSEDVIRNALNLLGVDVFFQMIAIGLIIVVAVEADVLRNRLEARARVMQAARGQ